MPFFKDNLFGAFDEDRTETGLRLLARLGETTQVVVFTNHAYVVDRARKVLANRPEIVSL